MKLAIAGILAAASLGMTAGAALADGPAQSSCWGQASAVFAQTGEMGEHASAQAEPRLGLRNLARALFDEGVIADDSLQSLGAFVADALGLSVDACTTT